MNNRKNHPRMDFKRNNFIDLNGEWNFYFDDKNVGIKEEFYNNFPKDKLKINVPFAYQTKLSNINLREKHDIIWYNKTINLKKGDYQINFGAIDYEADIYIDGAHKVNHIGGETPFFSRFNIDKDKDVEVTVRCYDPLFNEEIPRGKQFWEEESRSIWYTPTSGIWQSVWIEQIDKVVIEELYCNSNVDTGIQTIDIINSGSFEGKELRLQVSCEGNLIYSGSQVIINQKSTFTFDMYTNNIFKIPFHSGGKESVCWSPENPRLFDYKVEVVDDQQIFDTVESYFGFRKIHTENGMTYLNNNPYYFKLVLDQGYWEDGLLTAPSEEDFKKDILLAKEMGFNGCRKHQKVEDPMFLYYADKLGFLVWGEISSCPVYSSKAVEASQKSWFEIIKRDYNHPSIVAWVPLNESWGVPNIKFDDKQQAHSLALYYQIKSIDNTRLVVNNDGWEQTITDICAIHNYNHGALDNIRDQEYFEETMVNEAKILSTRPAGKPIFADGFKYQDQPILITEFGGIAYDTKHPTGWGYTSVNSGEKLLAEYSRIIDVFSKSDCIYGYCYTQLCDVEQEVNGFLTYDRKPKCSLEEIKKINDSIHIKY